MFISHAARKVIHPNVTIILTWCSVSTWGAPLTSISLMSGVTLARVDIVSLNTIQSWWNYNNSIRNITYSKKIFLLPHVEGGHYEEIDCLLHHCGLMPHPLLTIFLSEYGLNVAKITILDVQSIMVFSSQERQVKGSLH